jgi:hypothetical protein
MKKIHVQRIAHFTGHSDALFALCPALHPNRFYTSGADGMIVEWDTTNPSEGQLIAKVNSPVYFLAVHPQHLWLLAGTSKGNLHVIDLALSKEIRNIEAHTHGVYHIHYLQKHELLLTCGGDGQIKMWNRNDFTLLRSLAASEKNVRILAVNSDETQFAAGYSDQSIREWSLPDLNLRNEWEAHKSSVFGLSYSPDNRFILSGGMDAILAIWNNTQPATLFKYINAHLLHIKYISYNPDGNLFATVSMDKTLKIWDAANFELLKVIDLARHNGHHSSINKIVWLDNMHLITCSDDRSAILWQLELNEK